MALTYTYLVHFAPSSEYPSRLHATIEVAGTGQIVADGLVPRALVENATKPGWRVTLALDEVDGHRGV